MFFIVGVIPSFPAENQQFNWPSQHHGKESKGGLYRTYVWLGLPANLLVVIVARSRVPWFGRSGSLVWNEFLLGLKKQPGGYKKRPGGGLREGLLGSAEVTSIC